jgi:hypothetical protein
MWFGYNSELKLNNFRTRLPTFTKWTVQKFFKFDTIKLKAGQYIWGGGCSKKGLLKYLKTRQNCAIIVNVEFIRIGNQHHILCVTQLHRKLNVCQSLMKYIKAGCHRSSWMIIMDGSSKVNSMEEPKCVYIDHQNWTGNFIWKWRQLKSWV